MTSADGLYNDGEGAFEAAEELVGTILKCHISRVSGKLADDMAEERV